MSEGGRKHTPPIDAVRDYFETLWANGDPWDLETSDYDQDKYSRELALIRSRPLRRVLELGCAGGAFTRRLASIAERIVALDIAPRAIERARAGGVEGGRIDYRVADIITFDPVEEGPWDLVVLSETIYYVGWRYSFFEVGWLASRIFESLQPGGSLLMSNTVSVAGHFLQREWLLKTYRDLFVNVGLTLEHTERYDGIKAGERLEAVLTLFRKQDG
jgi:SAM-dependent methyltransferase